MHGLAIARREPFEARAFGALLTDTVNKIQGFLLHPRSVRLKSGPVRAPRACRSVHTDPLPLIARGYAAAISVLMLLASLYGFGRSKANSDTI